MTNFCEGCPLADQSDPIGMRGPQSAKYLIVTDTPSTKNAASNRLLSRSAMSLLGSALMDAGFDKDDFAFAPAIRCAHDADTFTTKQKREIAAHCRNYLIEDVLKMRPQAVLPLGAEAAKQVFGRPVKITKVRGQASFEAEMRGQVFPLINPSQCVMYPQHTPILRADCMSFGRMVDHAFDAKKASEALLGNYEFIDDLQFLIDAKPEVLAFDTENTGLRWFQPGTDVREYSPDIHKGDPDYRPAAAVLTMQFCIEPGKAYLLVWDHPENPRSYRSKAKLRKQLRELLNAPHTKVVGQNAKYDRVYVRNVEGVDYPIGGDTLMLGVLIDENAMEKNQDVLVKRYVPSRAGYADCIAPDTQVLTSDMRKVRAGDLRVGDELCAFTSGTDGRKAARRRMSKSTVLGVQRLMRTCIEIETESGRQVTVSSGHLMLCKHGLSDKGGGWGWRRADSLQIGSVLKPFPWEDPVDGFDAGYVSGVIDGEGWLCAGKLRLGIAQQSGAVLDKVREVLHYNEVPVGHSTDKRKHAHVVNLTFDGKDCIRALQMFRPRRLLQSCKWEGAGLPTNGFVHDRVVRLTYVGVREVVGLETSTQTVITNGLLSHNSFNSTVDKSRMWEVPLDRLLDYGAGDAETCFMLHDVLYREVSQDKKLLNHYNRVSIPGNNVFSLIESAGLHIDFAALNSFQQHMTEHVANLRQELIAQIPKSIKRKHVDKGLSLGRKDLLLDVLFWHPDGFRLRPRVYTKTTAKLALEMRVPSTSSKDHLPFFFEECPFTVTLAEYVKSERLLSTSILKFREKYIVDSLVRSVYSLATAVTGRTNSYDPNSQNYPARGENATVYRRMFVAPPGYIVVAADLSQAELRIAAHMANEPTMIKVYRSGGDIHITTALIVLGVGLEEFKQLLKAEQKSARQKAKAVNFGFIFGMWWKKFVIYAKTQYGVEFTDAEAQAVYDGYFGKYAALGPWHQSQKEFARKHKHVRSLDGRIRHLPMIDSEEEYIRKEAERQAINSPVQGFASDLGVMAMARLAQDIDPRYLTPVAFVHDAIYCYVPEEYADWGARTLKWYMETNPLEEWFDLKLRVPIVADVSVGRNFGDMHELGEVDTDTPYDWSLLWDDEKQTGLQVVEQRSPPNNGRRAVQEVIFPVDRVVAHKRIKRYT